MNDELYISTMQVFRNLLQFGFGRTAGSLFADIVLRWELVLNSMSAPRNAEKKAELEAIVETHESLLATIWSELKKITAQRRDSDRRYRAASKATTRIARVMGDLCVGENLERYRKLFGRVLGEDANLLEQQIQSAKKRREEQS